ncbi:MAG: hypothetical protein JNJ56_02655 [Ignavibacteria bacterium]|nr:hypothetical protein [Ignavibacteria bacterium]
MKNLYRSAVLITLFIFGTSLQSKVFSYPKFAALSGNMCIDCHVNPDGGGMRNGGGNFYAKNNLNMDLFKKLAGKTEFSPKITKDITLGSDVRVAQVDNERADTAKSYSNYNAFLAMQGSIYFNAQINKILNIYASSGIIVPGYETEYEVFGMLSNLPANLFFKAGRFKPEYGIRIVEHRAYQRKYLLNAPDNANTGFELGINPGWFALNAGLYNPPQSSEFSGFDPHKMLIANTNFNFAFEKYFFNINFGGSFMNNPFNTYDSTFTGVITALKQSFGANARFGFLKTIALLSEVDFEQNTSDFPMRRSFYNFNELDIIILKGLELRFQYEIYDKNRDVPDDDITRVSTGFAAYPFYGFETEIMVRFVNETPKIKNNEFQWNFHFYF